MIHQKTYSAESYKMINYGLGGHIEVRYEDKKGFKVQSCRSVVNLI